MKTYIICTSPIGPSVPNYFFSLAKRLVELGNKVFIVLDHNYDGEKDYHGVQLCSWPSNRPTKFKDFIFFFKLCKKVKPDVTICQFGSTNIVLFVSWLLGISNRINYYHSVTIALRIDSGKKFHIRSQIKKFILNNFATNIFINSQSTKEEISDGFIKNPNKINVFYLLIPDKFKNLKINKLSDRKQQLSFVGRIDKSKGQEVVIDRIPQLIKIYPEMVVTFVGDGPEKERLEKKCNELNINQSVNFVGIKKLNEVLEIMSNSLININASIGESFGLVNIEALSCGTPIIAPKVGGIREIIKDGENGYFFDPYSEDSLIEKVTLIMKNWEYHSEQARLSFQEKFSIDNPSVFNGQIEKMNEIFHF